MKDFKRGSEIEALAGSGRACRRSEPRRGREAWWVARRRFCLARDALLERGFYVPALVMVVTVWGIGFGEGLLLADGPGSIWFAALYGLCNILPSILWSTMPADLVARAAGLDPLAVIHPAAEASVGLQVWALNLSWLRALVSGFIFINYVLRVAGLATEARATYRERVFAGREPPFPARHGRVLRLAGEVSDVTDHDLRLGDGSLWPVYENPHRLHDLVERCGGGSAPVFWHVAPGGYGRADSWDDLTVGADWLHVDADGKSVLLLEADATVSEKSLTLDAGSVCDLELEEVAQGFRAVEHLFERSAIRPDRTVRILLGDLHRLRATGGGLRYKQREWLERYREANILIDARAPVLAAVLAWLESVRGGATRVGFSTHDPRHFAAMAHLLRAHGWQVVDSHGIGPEDPCPRVVYHRTTADTVHVTRALIRNGEAPPSRCLALLCRADGVAEMEDLAEFVGEPVAYVCTARVYHALFEDVRAAVLSGRTIEGVQQDLDRRLSKFPA